MLLLVLRNKTATSVVFVEVAGKSERRSRGRDETRLEQETQSERGNTSKHSREELELVRRALSYREIAQRLPWCCTWRVISTSTPTGAVRGAHLAPLATLTRATHACGCIRRARVTTPTSSTEAAPPIAPYIGGGDMPPRPLCTLRPWM